MCVAPARWAACWVLSSNTAWPGPAHVSCVTCVLRWQVWTASPQACTAHTGASPWAPWRQKHSAPFSAQSTRVPGASAAAVHERPGQDEAAVRALRGTSSRPPFTRPSRGSGSLSCEGLAGPSWDEQSGDSRSGACVGVRRAAIQGRWWCGAQCSRLAVHGDAEE